MEVTGIGTAVMLAVAAGLWFLYLVPTWLKRREYLETERTATRLQQTLRVLAETSETPDVVHVEATLRDAARQERELRAAERAERRRLAQELRREEAAERAADRAAGIGARGPVLSPGQLRRRRARRTRRFASVLMVVATIVGVVQIVLMATTGAVTGSWVVLAVAATGAFTAVGIQRRLDAANAPRVRAAAAEVVRHTPVETVAPIAEPAAPTRDWTPVPLPRPRYLERPAPQPIVPPVDAAALLRAAHAEAERARRAAHDEPEVVPFRPRAVPAAPAASAPAPAPRPAAPSRFASMGLVDPRDTAAPDLDEVLRRRRTAG
jgi:hypothetical protein